jgi:hypothetical protein
MSIVAAGDPNVAWSSKEAASQASLSYTFVLPQGAIMSTPPPCSVTLPNGSVPPAGGPTPHVGNHGNGTLWVELPPDGVIRFGPEVVNPDGWIRQKFMFWRGVSGQVVVEGRRLDAPASLAKGGSSTGYGATGFVPGGIEFPTEGCWEITAYVRDGGKPNGPPLMFVVLVVKAGDSPAPSVVATGVPTTPVAVGPTATTQALRAAGIPRVGSTPDIGPWVLATLAVLGTGLLILGLLARSGVFSARR